MTDFEIELARSLDRALPRQPFAGDWQSVLEAGGSHQSWIRRRHRRLVVATAVAAVVVGAPLTAFAVSNDWWFLGVSPLAPPPIGKVIIVREGDTNGVHWALTAYRSANQGLCVGFTPNPPSNFPPSPVARNAGLSCGAHVRGMPDVPPAEAHSFSFFGSFSDATTPPAFPDFVAGTTADDVDRIRVVRADGEVLTVDTFAAPDELGMPLRFFVALVPAGSRVHELVALDSAGGAVDRGVLPTPPAITTTTHNGKQFTGTDFAWGS